MTNSVDFSLKFKAEPSPRSPSLKVPKTHAYSDWFVNWVDATLVGSSKSIS